MSNSSNSSKNISNLFRQFKRISISSLTLFLAVFLLFGMVLSSCGKTPSALSDTSSRGEETQTTIASQETGTTKLTKPSMTTQTFLTFNRTFNENGYYIDKDLPNIVFIGNSLIFSGKIPKHVNNISQLGGQPVNCINLTRSGSHLSEHVEWMKDSMYDEVCEKADIVIVQEYGGKEFDCRGSVQKLMARFNSNAKFYFLLTEHDINVNREFELKDMNITVIPAGRVHHKLLTNGFVYDQLHMPNDFHPNELFGYVSSLTICATIFGIPAKDMYYFWMEPDMYPLLYSTTTQDMHTCMQDIQRMVDEVVTSYKDKKL